MSEQTSPNPHALPNLSRTKFIFFNTDFCPFGQRGWMTLLEKKVDFKHIEVNCFNKSLEMTKLFLDVSNAGTVPAGIHQGKNIYDSIPFCKYLDEMFPENSLFPGTPYTRWEANTLLKKINDDFVPLFYKVLTNNDSMKATQLQHNLLELLKQFNIHLGRGGGPWFMGEQFTLVDISLLPFCERMVVLFPYYKHFEIPKTEEFSLFYSWMERGFQRESFKITSADRSDQSMKVQPFKNRERKAYLREMYQAYALNQPALLKKLLVNSMGPDSAVDIKGYLKQSQQTHSKVAPKSAPSSPIVPK